MRRISRTPNSIWHLSPTLFLWSLLGVLLILGTIVAIGERSVAKQGSAKTDSESLIVRRATTTDHLIGSLSAPVQLVVYADLSCPYCKDFFNATLPKLQAKYGDNIVVAFRHLPLHSHPSSRLEANAAECVNQIGDTGAFWRFVRAVYAHPEYEKGLTVSTLSDIADEIGVSRANVSKCAQSGANDTRINADALEASIGGMSLTPSIVLKSATRALIVQGNYFGQLDSGINYLLKTGR